ncbi:MAG: CdvA-like protein [Thaumarchaeota archaeon]|nr:CdvA-like protein [Nitrososphaerota archaeon]
MPDNDSNIFQRFMGKRVRDVYGRYIGFVIGLSTDPFGELRAVGVDSGERGLVEFPGACVRQDGDSLLLLPVWRVDADKFRRETLLINNRSTAVEDLLKEGEITQEEYQEFLKVYQGYRTKLDDVKKVIDEKLKKRNQELDRETKDLKRMATNVKVQFKSAEIEAETFRASLQYVAVMKERIDKERADIAATASMLAAPTPTASQMVEESVEHPAIPMESPQSEELAPVQAVQVDGSVPTEAGWLARFLKGRQ